MAEPTESNVSTPSSAQSEDGDNGEMQKKPEPSTSTDSKLECPVCLQTCVHPVRLPCSHIFCFLCVKGVAFKNLRCAMCRCEIPLTYLDHPQLVNGVEEIVRAATATEPDGNEYRWYYEGCHGWWQYDERTSQELEEAYLRGEKSCKILVAGFVYIVTFEHKCQIRQNDYSRIRRVKRDLVSIPKKGVAGLRLESGNVPAPTTSDMNELSSAMGEMNLNEGASTSTFAAGTDVRNVLGTHVVAESNHLVASTTDSAEEQTPAVQANDATDLLSTTTMASPSSTASNSSSRSVSSSTRNYRLQELIDLDHNEYSASDSDEEERSDVDDNLLEL
ncbi:E3 ubiquitin-protein ligase rnf146 [Anopheles nili]|uniref:E3 ubiquitin-protein ligase rnf146 n=1 Tax=Anopheles nili TaxID=185578 RepID=UPI00237C3442|nr:E3 ubiquitin-protein ligase rnf146 [Anopheles nili]